jgi:hypothetical protein
MVLGLKLSHRFSEKESDHWFSAESHGLSIASESWRDTRFPMDVDYYQALLFYP